MVRVAVVGASGYAGEELLKILVKHPRVKITSLSAKIDKAQKIGKIFPDLAKIKDLVCAEPNFNQIIPESDLAFLALPHRVSMEVAPRFLKAQKKVIDLSADYRLKDISVYEDWYEVKHKSPEYLENAVYGLPEIYRKKIAQANFVANPGCYPTGALIGCLPLLAENIANTDNIIIDAKTGLSGAGREKETLLIPQMKNNFRAYKVDAHQHAPEINQELSNFTGRRIEIVFVPHLIPIKRGILSTIYLSLKKDISEKDILQLYQDYYKNEPFVNVFPEGKLPEVKDAAETNFCHLGLKVNPARKLAIIICAIDNLVKGASGQAVQNMNIMYGFKETEGLL